MASPLARDLWQAILFTRVPTSAARSGCLPDAVVNGETGLLVDCHNVDEIAAAIVRLLTDAHYARQLGENGRRRVMNELSWARVAGRLDQVLGTFLGPTMKG